MTTKWDIDYDNFRTCINKANNDELFVYLQDIFILLQSKLCTQSKNE